MNLLASAYRRVMYEWVYRTSSSVWDKHLHLGVLADLVERQHIPPGRALDIGCGTGRFSIYLARHGFRVTGIDYVSRALDQARANARAARVTVDWRQVDVLHPTTLGGTFDLVLDIGCFHNFDPAEQKQYLSSLLKWTHAGSVYLLSAVFPGKQYGRGVGLEPAEVRAVFLPHFLERDFLLGASESGRNVGWYRFERKQEA